MIKKKNINSLYLSDIIKEKRKLYLSFFFLFLLLSSIFTILFSIIKAFNLEKKYTNISLLIYILFSIIFILTVVFLISKSISLTKIQHLLFKKSLDTAKSFDDIDSLSINPNEIVSKNIVTLTSFVLQEKKIEDYEKISVNFVEKKPFVFVTKNNETFKIDFDQIEVQNNTVYQAMIKENNDLIEQTNIDLVKKMCYNYFKL